MPDRLTRHRAVELSGVRRDGTYPDNSERRSDNCRQRESAPDRRRRDRCPHGWLEAGSPRRDKVRSDQPSAWEWNHCATTRLSRAAATAKEPWDRVTNSVAADNMRPVFRLGGYLVIRALDACFGFFIAKNLGEGNVVSFALSGLIAGVNL